MFFVSSLSGGEAKIDRSIAIDRPVCRGLRARCADRAGIHRALGCGLGSPTVAGAQGPTMCRCKLPFVDGVPRAVCSGNFDSRSFGLDDDAALNLADPGFARPRRPTSKPIAHWPARSALRRGRPGRRVAWLRWSRGNREGVRSRTDAAGSRHEHACPSPARRVPGICSPADPVPGQSTARGRHAMNIIHLAHRRLGEPAGDREPVPTWQHARIAQAAAFAPPSLPDEATP
jgi:hypothetical protein